MEGGEGPSLMAEAVSEKRATPPETPTKELEKKKISLPRLRKERNKLRYTRA
jgi:hypothetical protein